MNTEDTTPGKAWARNRDQAARDLIRVATDSHRAIGTLRLARRVNLIDRGTYIDLVAAARGRARAAAAGVVTGVAVLALALVAVAAGPTPAAQATEAPEPDPAVVSVTLTSGAVHAFVPVTANSATPSGIHCATVWGPTSYGRGFVGRACSRTVRFRVAVTLDSRFVPLGRSTMAVTDDVDPLGTFPQTVTLTARRPSRFGVGTWTPTQFGDGMVVHATLYAYTPALGRWTPQQASPVKVQELRAGHWVTIAKGATNRRGAFLITVITGGGLHTLRVHRDPGANVAPTNGAAHDFYLYPTDVPDGTV